MGLSDRSQLARNAIVLLGFILIIGLGWSTVYRSGPHTFGETTWGSRVHRTDFTVYQAAGRAVVAGTDIYQAHNRRHWYFMYLPLFAIAMVPFARMNAFWGSLLWYIFSLGMMAHALSLSVRVARKSFPDSRIGEFWLYTLTALLVLWPAMSALARGQAAILVSYLVIASAWFSLQERYDWAGFCLAASIIVKVFPALLLAYFLVLRKLRSVAVTTVFLVLFLWIIPGAVLGMRQNAQFLREWWVTIALPAMRPEQARENIRFSQLINPYIPKNQSLQALLIRELADAAAESPRPDRERLARRMATVIGILLFLLTIWASPGRGKDQHDQDAVLQFCLIIPMMLFVSPVSWMQNYTLLALPLAVALSAASRTTPHPMTWMFRLALIIYFAANLISLALRPFYGHGALLWGAMVLWGAFVRAAVKARRSRRWPTGGLIAHGRDHSQTPSSTRQGGLP